MNLPPLDPLSALLGVGIMSLVTFATRATPFVLFRKHKPGPRFLRFQDLLPPTILSILLVYSIKDTLLGSLGPMGWEKTSLTLGALGLVGLLHVLWRNPLISIFGGTMAFMIFAQILGV